MPTIFIDRDPEGAPPKPTQEPPRAVGSVMYWCRECDAPLLEPICNRCGRTGRRFIADAKPVFVPERHLLEEIVGKPLPSSLYSSGNRVYYRGKLLFSFAVSAEQVRVTADHTDTLTPADLCESDDAVSTKSAVEANLNALHHLEEEALNSIRAIMFEYPGRSPVVSFSGGKDSAAVAHLVWKALGETHEVSLFFGDTTLEHPDTEEYVRAFARHYGVPLTINRAKNDFLAMCDELEPPSRIMRWCCTVFKANPLNEYLRDHTNILSFDGIRRRESNSRRGYERISGNKKALTQLVFRPILEWSTMSVWLYIMANNIPYNPAYDRGYARVGCVICPYSTEYNDFLTRRHYPVKSENWEATLTRYFQNEYTDRFDSQAAEDWIKQGLWKRRKPHHRNRDDTIREPTCPSLRQCAYHLGSTVQADMLEYLKPLGDLKLLSDCRTFTVIDAERYYISGMLGDNLLSVSFTKPNFHQDMYLLERQLKKAMNCVKCAACSATCPHHAIEVYPGTRFEVNDARCTHCLACVRSDFTHYGCVALSYKCVRNWIAEE